MPTESTSLKNATPAGDSNTADDRVIWKSNTYQRSFLIVAGSLLALLVWIAIAGTTSGPYFQSSSHEITKGAVALADFQVDSANVLFTKDIFVLGAASENDEGCDFAAGKCPNIPGSVCVTPNGQDIPCGSEGNCSMMCCGKNGDTDCCMCQEYCDKHCKSSATRQFHCSGCFCCNVPCTNTDCYYGQYCNCGVSGCPNSYVP